MSPYTQKTGLALAGTAMVPPRAQQLVAHRDFHAAKKLADRLEHQLQLAGLEERDESEIEDLPDSGEEQ